MFSKKYLAITLSSFFTLTACGSGNDDTNTSQPPVVQQKTEQWVKFKIPGNFTAYDDEYSEAEYSSQTVTIQNGKLYVKQFNPLLSTIGQEPIYITTDSIYTNGPRDKDLGVLVGSVTVTNTEWLLKPYSPININQLEIKSEYKLLNISGQDILESIEPYIAVNERNVPATEQLYPHNMQIFKTFNSLKDKKFPAGSSCLQLQNITQNQDTLNLKSGDQELLKEYWNSNIDLYPPEIYKQTEAFISPELYKLGIVYKPDDLDPLKNNVNYFPGIAKFSNKFYEVKKIPKGVRYDPLPLKLEQQKMFNGYDQDYPELAIETQIKKAIEQSCDYLNPVATKAVHDILGTPPNK